MFEPQRNRSTEVAMPQSILTLAQYSPDVRETLKAEVSGICHDVYRSERELFYSTLSDYERVVYAEIVKLPYDEKDFWRDLHDIIVTSQLKQLVSSSSGSIPEWLVVAALMHDRGYALLAEISRRGKGTLAQRGYLSLSGAHWDGVNTRIQHSFLSSKVAEYLLTGGTDEPTVVEILTQYGIASCLPPNHIALKSSEIISVILQHDLPLIGRYREISRDACHHFDADSLYSISVTSFLKDYLFYLSDEEMTQGHGTFEPQDLLRRRLNRYFPADETFPSILNSMIFGKADNPLSETIRPHSPKALERTTEAFLRIERLLQELSTTISSVEFSSIVRRYVIEEMRTLL